MWPELKRVAKQPLRTKTLAPSAAAIELPDHLRNRAREEKNPTRVIVIQIAMIAWFGANR
jgi:hypothetical protein